jgi:MFS family permease
MKLFNTVHRSVEQANYHHFVWDIVWYGIALAATKSFLQIYAIRLNASPLQIALITSLPAICALLSSVAFSSRWRNRFTSTSRAISFPAFCQRFIFLLPAFAPFFPVEWRAVWLIFAICLPALGEGVASVVFLSMFRETIPETRTTSLLSVRSLAVNVVLGLTTIILLGWFGLGVVPYPLNYQLMFGIAFVAAFASLWHVTRVRSNDTPKVTTQTQSKVNAWRSTGFRQVVFAVVVTHVAFMSVYAVQPLHLVKQLGANEAFMAAFGLMELLGGIIASLLATRIIARIGNSNTMVLSMIATAIGSLIIALAPNLWMTLIAAVYTWGGWTLTGITLFRLFTEKTRDVQPQDMVKFSGAYYQTIAISVFIGPLLGSSFANGGVSVVLLLVVGAVLRLVAGVLTHQSIVEHIEHTPVVVHAGVGD